MKRLIIILAAVVTALALWAFVDGGTAKADRVRSIRKMQSFKEISVSTGIHLQVTSSVDQVVVETASSQLKYVKTVIDDNKLKVYIDNDGNRIKRFSSVKVYVPMKAYSLISTSSGSTVTLDNGFKTNNIDLHASSGSSMVGYIEANNISIDAGSGSSVNLKGKSIGLDVECSSGSSCICSELLADNVICRTSSGSTAKVNAAKKLTAKASSGSTIKYTGVCTVVDISKSSGASVKKM